MSKLKWSDSKPLVNGDEVEKFENRYGVDLPCELKEVIENYNAGVPSLYVIDSFYGDSYIFGNLLSFNEDDIDNIYEYIEMFEDDFGRRLTLIPFGIDSFGNFFCIDEDDKVVFYYSESGSTDCLADNFEEFLNLLY